MDIGANSASRTLTGATGSYLRQLASALPGSIKQDSLLTLIILVYWSCGLIAAGMAGIPPLTTITTYLGTYVPIAATTILSLILGRGALIISVIGRSDPCSS